MKRQKNKAALVLAGEPVPPQSSVSFFFLTWHPLQEVWIDKNSLFWCLYLLLSAECHRLWQVLGLPCWSISFCSLLSPCVYFQVPGLCEDLLSSVDQPLKITQDKAVGKDYLLCDYNRDGDSYRSSILTAPQLWMRNMQFFFSWLYLVHYILSKLS